VHPGGDDANRIPNIFHYPFRFIFHLKHYPRPSPILLPYPLLWVPVRRKYKLRNKRADFS
jgi:hypothetical protein